MSERATTENALRGPRWTHVIKRLNKTVQLRSIQHGGVTFLGDMERAEDCGLRVRRTATGRLRIDMRRALPSHPRHDPRFHNLVRDLIEAASSGAAPAPVVEVVRPDGRKTFAHDVATRAAQLAIAGVLSTHVEPLLAPTSFAYRPGLSRDHAAFALRRLVRAGYCYATAGDVRKYFDNIHTHQIVNAIVELLPSVSTGLLRFVASTTKAPILRRARHPDVTAGTAPTYSPPRGTILQGSVLGPLLSNIVGHEVFDAPFQHVMRHDALLLRSSDDFVVLGRAPAAAREGLSVMRALAKAAGFELHPGKTRENPVDLAKSEIVWLGRAISASGVRTTRDALDRAIERVQAADPAEPGDRGVFVHLAYALALEPWSRVGEVAVEIYERCGESRWLAFDVAMQDVRPERSLLIRSFESRAAKIMLEVAA